MTTLNCKRKWLRWFPVLLVGWCCVGMGGWSLVKEPLPGLPRVVGAYASGCIEGAQPLLAEGEGFRVMRRYRNRYYGHPDTLGVVVALGRQLAGRGVMLVGDLSQPRGGPTDYGHHSHQTGLDVDIWYNYLPVGGVIPLDLDEAGEISFLTVDQRHVDVGRWGEFQTWMVKLAAMAPRVERIFVHPAVKEMFCVTDRGAVWLGKLRPWWGHGDHMHVRLSCPLGSPGCIKQRVLPEGDGCEGGFGWWFSEDAMERGREVMRQDREPVPGPAAPAACLPLLGR